MTETTPAPVQEQPTKKQEPSHDPNHFDVCPKCAFPRNATRPCLCDFS